MMVKISLNKKTCKNKNLIRIQLNLTPKNSVNFLKITKMDLSNQKKRVSAAINRKVMEITKKKTRVSTITCLPTRQIKVLEIYQEKSLTNLSQRRFQIQIQKQSGPLSQKKSQKLGRKSTKSIFYHKNRIINFQEKSKMMKTSHGGQLSE